MVIETRQTYSFGPKRVKYTAEPKITSIKVQGVVISLINVLMQQAVVVVVALVVNVVVVVVASAALLSSPLPFSSSTVAGLWLSHRPRRNQTTGFCS